MDRFEMEERRRTWWVAFAADRLVAATTSLPALISTREVSELRGHDPGSELVQETDLIKDENYSAKIRRSVRRRK